MAQAAAKKISEMDTEEYKTHREKFIKGDGTKWDFLVTSIRSMSNAELAAFETQFGIAITILPKKD